MNEPLFLGRQPVLDHNHTLVGYELLFRSGQGNSARFSDDLAATATVINHSFSDIGCEVALGPYDGYINLSAPLLMSEIIESLPNDRVIFEILETVAIDAGIVERCRLLKSMGYRLALDDVVDFTESMASIIDMIDIVKIDASMVEEARLPELIEKFRRHPVRLLAEKVETEEQFDLYQRLGFDLFQGYYFARPHIIQGKRLSHSEAVIMKLFSLITEDADTPEIEQAIKASPTLSYRLLKLANSAARGANSEISSIRSAITLLGMQSLKRWLQILIYSQTAKDRAFPSPLLQLAATRGKTMENLVSGKRDANLSGKAFMVGIMSLMDALLAISLQEIVASLALSQDIKSALIENKGELGELLLLASALEKKTIREIDLSGLPYLTLHDLSVAHAEALSWANGIGG